MLERNKIYEGDCRELLLKLDDDSVDCCITSPPYWSLRDYGIEPTVWDGDAECEHDFNIKTRNIKKSNNSGLVGLRGPNDKPGQIYMDENRVSNIKEGFCSKCGAWLGCLGLEPNFELFIKHLCDIYDIVMQKLKKTGTCWVNLGDSYHNASKWSSKKSLPQTIAKGNNRDYIATRKQNQGLPEKCLCLIPQRFAIKMVSRGWILRNVIIWHKPNCMPSSAKDRFTVDFEYVYFFVKRKKYSFTQQKEEATTKFIYSKNSKKGGVQDKNNPRANSNRIPTRKELKYGKCEKYYFEQQREALSPESIKDISKRNMTKVFLDGSKGSKTFTENSPKSNDKSKRSRSEFYDMRGRNKRCVWKIPTKPNKAAHFATFPPNLVKPMILSGCPEFVCSVCGKTREKIIEKQLIDTEGWGKAKKDHQKGIGTPISTIRNNKGRMGSNIIKEKGYTVCGCNAPFVSGITLDIFAGTGTTCKTAFELGRDYIGFEISKEYKKIYDKIMSPTKNKRLTEFL